MSDLVYYLSRKIPLDRDTFEALADFAQTVAVTGDPMETGHVLGKHVVGAVETDVNLRSAHRQRRGPSRSWPVSRSIIRLKSGTTLVTVCPTGISTFGAAP